MLKTIVKFNELYKGDLVAIITKDNSYKQCYFYNFTNRTDVNFFDLMTSRKIISTEDKLLFIKTIKEYIHCDEYKTIDAGLFLCKNKLLFVPLSFDVKYKILCTNKNRECNEKLL